MYNNGLTDLESPNGLPDFLAKNQHDLAKVKIKRKDRIILNGLTKVVMKKHYMVCRHLKHVCEHPAPHVAVFPHSSNGHHC